MIEKILKRGVWFIIFSARAFSVVVGNYRLRRRNDINDFTATTSEFKINDK